MPLPGSAIEFLDIALESIGECGVIHLYSFVKEEDFKPVEEKMEEITADKGLEYKVMDRVRCGYKSPSEDRYCFDIKVL
jgi:tRNA G37 N-methylase Trm5